MKYKFSLKPAAILDLDNHFIYLAENSSVDTAIRFDESSQTAFSLLSNSPFIGAVRRFSDFQPEEPRMWFVKDFEDYLIFYHVYETSLEIIRVLHSSQDVENIISTDSEN